MLLVVEQQNGGSATCLAIDDQQCAQLAQQNVSRRQRVSGRTGRTNRGALAAAGADLVVDHNVIAVRRNSAGRAKVEASVTANDTRA